LTKRSRLWRLLALTLIGVVAVVVYTLTGDPSFLDGIIGGVLVAVALLALDQFARLRGKR
jgi:hypothetical protein